MKAIFIRGFMKNILFVTLILVSGLALAFTDEDQNTFDEKFKESIGYPLKPGQNQGFAAQSCIMS